jgi:3-oxosteroid 1-dehydrogenase
MDAEVAPRESAAPAAPGTFDAEADVVVVVVGGGGLPAALFSRWLGNEVILLEKAPELGGTARKAAF